MGCVGCGHKYPGMGSNRPMITPNSGRYRISSPSRVKATPTPPAAGVVTPTPVAPAPVAPVVPDKPT